MTALGKRVSRLEKWLVPDPDDSLQFKALSDDQLYIGLLDEGRAPHPATPPEQLAELIAWIPDIEDKIRRCAASCANLDYAEHWSEVAERWVAANPGGGDFVPDHKQHMPIGHAGRNAVARRNSGTARYRGANCGRRT